MAGPTNERYASFQTALYTQGGQRVEVDIIRNESVRVDIAVTMKPVDDPTAVLTSRIELTMEELHTFLRSTLNNLAAFKQIHQT